MKRWVLFVDVFWALVLAFALVACVAGYMPWYKAAFLLAPFGVYLATRSLLVPKRREREEHDTRGRA